ncbi:hypothetical protein AJ79_01953 [Helicocarpus griseus UAMH5409]|uniref:DNA repair metallo-beta-lactamase domain-containing protein n=1 Tax=Helicocarpus griseus UAMH5409 TaxID=1447875 RepID=A0A2B7Y3X0_9EURO|nr:hypothetical protein AJ79_01953 [Helicocarpus griseus UAMH5409]
MTSTSPYFNGNTSRSRQSTSRPSQSFSRRSSGKQQNTSILNFFKKTETPPKSSQNRITDYAVRYDSNKRGDTVKYEGDGPDSLFFPEETSGENVVGRGLDRTRSTSPFDLWPGQSSDEARYNENGTAGQKRRKVDASMPETTQTASKEPAPATALSKANRIGPFLDESDSEDEAIVADNRNLSFAPDTLTSTANSGTGIDSRPDSSDVPHASPITKGTAIPSTVTAATTTAKDKCLIIGQDTISLERRERTDYYEESVERDIELFNGHLDRATSMEPVDIDESDLFSDNETAVCPICSESLTGFTDSEASLHVNNCLDGNPTPTSAEKQSPAVESKSSVSIARSQKAAIRRPAQRNPFALESTEKNTSAFSKIMSGNAEDSAWVAAAAKEEASRGKQAYERTCPFYKILPGFSICVDAFRYGSVEGCNAYFLSHFHTDHYMGLTSSWRHGQIYCSSVTGKLVRQQLKVDPKWVTDIEFESTVEIPETDGVRVTMLPANHCPGSSLFLFEKQVGKGSNPKVHRILHCGDFRACPAHVQHPLLRPEVVDSVTRKSRQQVIDVCYLDTTYLNPKYAFPNQEDVVTSCADICAILDNRRQVDADRTAQGSNAAAMKAMANFLSKDTQTEAQSSKSTGGLLVVIGTYSIGKERICVAIARALKSKIYAPAAKQKICACLEDEELSSLLTSNPLEAQVHMQTLMEVRAETLRDYLITFKPHFSRVVGFRPTGWNYRPPAGRMIDSPPVNAVLYSDSWQPRFCAKDLIPQRGSNQESTCYSVPYSEHSSFRELTMFCCALRIAKVVPTVNVGTKKSRERMKFWVEKWEAEKRKNGLFKVDDKATRW